MRRHFARTLALGAASLAGGCSAVNVVNALVPSDTYRRSADIAYGPHPRQRLDVYEPAQQQRAADVVVFFYGGSWNSGARGDYRFAGEALASRGLVCVVPDYRLYPEVSFPGFLHDCAAAVAWTIANIARMNGNPTRLFLMGHSAGAYNAAMLALNPEYLDAAGVGSTQVRGWIGLAGAYDFLPLQSEVTRGVFGYPDTSVLTQPIHFASRDDPPALLATAQVDDVLDPGNTVRLAARLRALGVDVREIVYEHVNHARLVGALAAPLRRVAPVLDDVTAFIAAH